MSDYSGFHQNRGATWGYSHQAFVQDKVQGTLQQDWPKILNSKVHQGLREIGQINLDAPGYQTY
jgi:hypothetical protein